MSLPQSKTAHLESIIKDLERSHRKLSKSSIAINKTLEYDFYNNKELIRRIGNMKEVEHSAELQEALGALEHDFICQRDLLIELSSQLEYNIINGLKEFEESIKIQKEQIKQRNKEYSNYEKDRNKNGMIHNDVGGVQARAAGGYMNSRHAQMAVIEKKLNESLAMFEERRIAYVRDKNIRFLRSYIAYHAKSIELFSQALLRFDRVNPYQQALNFWTTLDELDFQGNFGKATEPPKFVTSVPMPYGGIKDNSHDANNSIDYQQTPLIQQQPQQYQQPITQQTNIQSQPIQQQPQQPMYVSQPVNQYPLYEQDEQGHVHHPRQLARPIQ